MTLVAGAKIVDIRKRGSEHQTLSAVAFWVIAAGVVGDLVVFPVVRMVQSARTADWSTFFPDVLMRVLESMPALILMSGLWCAQRVFGRVAEGDVFTEANAWDIERIGSAMGWCGAAVVFIVPTAKAWIEHASTFDIDLQGWAIVLALLGGAVALIGRIWALAVEIKTDADQII